MQKWVNVSKTQDEALKNGLMRYISEDGLFYYCNEKEYKGKGILMKCVPGCPHIPLES